MGAKSEQNFNAIEKEFNDFMLSFNSVSLATLNAQGEVVCSYAPFISTQWEIIFILVK